MLWVYKDVEEREVGEERDDWYVYANSRGFAVGTVVIIT
jgi:hypothetical protein